MLYRRLLYNWKKSDTIKADSEAEQLLRKALLTLAVIVFLFATFISVDLRLPSKSYTTVITSKKMLSESGSQYEQTVSYVLITPQKNLIIEAPVWEHMQLGDTLRFTHTAIFHRMLSVTFMMDNEPITRYKDRYVWLPFIAVMLAFTLWVKRTNFDWVITNGALNVLMLIVLITVYLIYK